jgi:hypothetical protein
MPTIEITGADSVLFLLIIACQGITWFRTASKDGSISKEEIRELVAMLLKDNSDKG